MKSVPLSEAIVQEAESIQKEMHQFCDELMAKNKKLTYDVCKDVFYMNKIAALQIELRQLRRSHLMQRPLKAK